MNNVKHEELARKSAIAGKIGGFIVDHLTTAVIAVYLYSVFCC